MFKLKHPTLQRNYVGSNHFHLRVRIFSFIIAHAVEYYEHQFAHTAENYEHQHSHYT